ncbi:MAG: phosphopantothenoylcysteine decarboxylase [Anaerovoracaceae bacterium]
MNLIITAGGTSERIDDVRSITNTSTGRLGKAIGEMFLKEYPNEIDKIYYLHGLRAEPLQGEKVTPIPIEGVADLKRAMGDLLSKKSIDGVVHAMAVSDYMVKEVTTMKAIKSGDNGKLVGNKISSNVEDLVVVLKQSPKVISIIKELSPKTVLVGFKLLSHVPHQELIQIGQGLLKKNGCTYVLANDLSEMGKDYHRGYLIHEDGTYDTMENNGEIGQMIARRVGESIKKQRRII